MDKMRRGSTQHPAGCSRRREWGRGEGGVQAARQDGGRAVRAAGMGRAGVAAILLTLCLLPGGGRGCNKDVRAVGVCLHQYLERDFLSMESIVYPQRSARRRDLLYESYSNVGELQGLPSGASSPPPPPPAAAEADTFTPLDNLGHRGWVEGPELEDYCSRLSSVVECFENVLVDCDNGYDFFRYRHLLYSLGLVHRYLCHNAHFRANRFLPFLKVIDCAENARQRHASCRRPNVTVNVWNQILRQELGPEVCDSLNTQRSCLLENGYVRQECGNMQEKEELYRNVSGIFLATWCRLPVHNHLLPLPAPAAQPAPSLLLLLLLLLATLAFAHSLPVSGSQMCQV